MKIQFQYKSKKSVIGAILALLALAVCIVWFSEKAGLAFAVLFLLAGAIRLEANERLSRIIVLLAGVGYAAVLCFLPSLMMSEERSFLALGAGKILANMGCAAVLMGLFFLLTASFRAAYVSAAVVLTVLTLGNCLVYQFRGKELMAMDFLSAATAMNVAGQYTPQITAPMVYTLLLTALCVLSVFALPKVPVKKKIRARAAAAGVVVLLAVTLHIGVQDIPIKTWRAEGTYFNGYYLNFALGIRDGIIRAPEGYSAEAVADYEESYGAAQEAQALPNIIIVMDEAFADLSTFGTELQSNEPLTPFIDSLQENTIKGKTLVSVFGGNTANSEFEMLSGLSLGFLPSGAVPYQQYVRSDTYSLARALDALGYDTFATHPFPANSWSRPIVYPHFGIESFAFLEAYPQQDVPRGYVSDKEAFDFLLQELESRVKEDAPQFLFCVTMQNHGPFDYVGDDFTPTVELEGLDGDYPMAEQFLSLIRETDRAVEYLIGELEKQEEDTIVLFFGDHLPNIEASLFEELNGGALDTLEEQMEQYTTPFFIWANFDIPEEEGIYTSLNYLANHLLQAADMDLSPMSRFLLDMEEVVPAMNALGYYSKSAGGFVTYDMARGEEAEWLGKYEQLQYNLLFDQKGRSSVFMSSGEND